MNDPGDPVIVEGAGMTLTLNRPTPDGIALGRELVRLIEPEIAKLVAAGEPDDRCASCAFRLGTIPNGCAPTVMDALKCALEDRPFYCHMGDGIRHGRVCHGWYAFRVGTGETFTVAPWAYSDGVQGS